MINTIKKSLSIGQHKKFWQELLTNSFDTISLIYNTESSDSNFTEGDSREFLSQETVKKETIAEIKASEDDDLFGMME